MADIDDELLALAGDDSSGGEEQVATNEGGRLSSSSPHGQPSIKSSAKKGGKKQGRRNDESEEEGEASSGDESARSGRSAPMDESDSDSDGPNFRDDGDRYPLEGKFMNSSDKEKVMKMTEVEREQVLADRAQEIERDRQNRALRQLLNAREVESKKKDRKRKFESTEDENQRKTSRQRTKPGGGKVGETSTGIDSLKRARAEKNDRQRRRDEDKERRGDDRRDTRGGSSDMDASADSEVEWDAAKSKKKSNSPDYRDAEPAVLHDAERVRVGRSRFALVCFFPGFEEAITGTFVRVSIGTDKETNQNLYRMGFVKGFKTGQPYALMSANGKSFSCDQYVVASHGKSEKHWPFVSCSDGKFTEAEWQRFKNTCNTDNVPIPTKPKLLAKCADINNLVNRRWTEEELQEKLKRSGALTAKHAPIERSRIDREMKEARARGNTERVEKLQAELEALNGPKLAYSTSLTSIPKKKAPTQQDRLALLNRVNRRKNVQEVRQAQINERRAARQTEAAIARGEEVDGDHSKRIKTRAKFKHDHEGRGDSERSATGTPATNTPTLEAKKDAAPLPLFASLKTIPNNGLPGFRRPLMDDEIIASIDIGIDDNIEL